MCSAEKKWGRGWQQHCSTTASAEPFNKGPLDPHPSDTPPDNLEARQGGQVDWFWGVPGALHALSAPLTGQPVPAAPAPSDPHQQSHGCWGALHYVLLHRLGWARPDRGLRWWYDQGKPVDDLTLSLISEVWDCDGNLDAYLAWLLQGQPVFLDPKPQPWAEWPTDREPLPPYWVRWVAEIQAAADLSGSSHFQGGRDPLHLSGHSGEAGEPDPASTLTVTSRSDRRAVFLTDTMDAWYFDLAKKAQKLPDTGQRAWRVDVFVRPVGFLRSLVERLEKRVLGVAVEDE